MFGIVKCKKCKKKIERNIICPSCGYDNRDFFLRHKLISLLICFFIIPVVGYCYYLFNTYDNEEFRNNYIKYRALNDSNNYKIPLEIKNIFHIIV